MAGVRNGALPKQALGFLPGTRSPSQEFAGQPPALCSAHSSSSRPSGTWGHPPPGSVAAADLGRQFFGVLESSGSDCPLGTGLSACRARHPRPPQPLGTWWDEGTPAKSLAPSHQEMAGVRSRPPQQSFFGWQSAKCQFILIFFF